MWHSYNIQGTLIHHTEETLKRDIRLQCCPGMGRNKDEFMQVGVSDSGIVADRNRKANYRRWQNLAPEELNCLSYICYCQLYNSNNFVFLFGFFHRGSCMFCHFLKVIFAPVGREVYYLNFLLKGIGLIWTNLDMAWTGRDVQIFMKFICFSTFSVSWKRVGRRINKFFNLHKKIIEERELGNG